MKKLTTLFATALAAAAISATAFAAAIISADEARAIAQKEVPATSTHLFTKAENKHFNPYYEVKFYDATTHTEYEIDVLQSNGAVKEFSMDVKNMMGSRVIALSANDIQALVQKEFPNAVIHEIELDTDDGFYEYEVKFHAPGLRGDMTFNPETGAVLEKDLKYQF